MPAKFDYKPLGLEAFAAPLGQMQQRYDKALETIDNAQFDISGLSSDSERAESLTAEFNVAKEELLDNLSNTKNYRQAAQKLRGLNKAYNNDAEITGVRANKAKYLAAEKEAKEQVKSGHISQQEFKEWQLKTLGEYNDQGGLNYDREMGTSNSINTDLRAKNLEKEIMDTAAKYASAGPEHITEMLSEWDYSDPEVMERIKSIRKMKGTNADNRVQLQSEIQNILKESKRYKDWAADEAKYKYYWDKKHSGNEEGFTSGVIEKANTKLADEKTRLEGLLPKAKTEEDKKLIDKLLKQNQKETSRFEGMVAEHTQNGTLDRLSESTYIMDRVNNRFPKIAGAMEDLYDYDNVSYSASSRTQGDGDGAKPTAIDVDDATVTVNTRSTTDATVEKVAQGTGSSTSTHQQKYEKGQKELYQYANFNKDNQDVKQLKNSFINRDVKISGTSNINPLTGQVDWNKNITNVKLDPGTLEGLNNTADNANFFYNMSTRVNDYDTKISKLSAERTSKQREMEAAKGVQKEELRGEMAQLSLEQSELEKEKLGEFGFINNIVDDVLSDNPELYKKYKQHGLGGTFDYIYDANMDALSSENQDRYIRYGNPIAGQSNLAGLEGAPLQNAIKSIENIDNPLGKEIKRRINTVLYKKYGAQPLEIVVDDKLSTWTGDNVDNAIQYISDRPIGTPGAPKVVTSFNYVTGEVEYNNHVENPISPNLKDDYLENPAFIGTTQDGDTQSMLFRYVRKNLSGEDISKHARIAADYTPTAWAQLPQEEKNPIIKKWYKNHPQTITVGLDATNHAPLVKRSIEGTFIDKAGSAMKMMAKDPTRIANYAETLQAAVDSYSAFDLLLNTSTRNEYAQMASKMNRALELRDETLDIWQAPAYWKPNGDDTYTGYSINYHYDEKSGGLIGDVYKITRDVMTNKDSTPEKLPEPKRVIGNLAQSMRGFDLYYGAGLESGVITESGQSYVPAFIQGDMVQSGQ